MPKQLKTDLDHELVLSSGQVSYFCLGVDISGCRMLKTDRSRSSTLLGASVRY